MLKAAAESSFCGGSICYSGIWFKKDVYSKTKPVLSNAPPIMSVSQCTPETSLPITIKALKTVIVQRTHCLCAGVLIRVFSCMMVVGITVRTRSVVDEG